MGSEFCPLSLGWISPLQSSQTSTSSTTPLFLLKQPQPRAVRPKMAIPPEVEARLGPAKDLEGLSDADLKAVLKEYYDRWVEAESQKYDVERDVHIKDMQIHDLEMEVSDMRQIHPSQVEEGAQLQADGRRRINSRVDFVVISKLLSNLISSTTKTYQPKIKTNLEKFYSKIKHNDPAHDE